MMKRIKLLLLLLLSVALQMSASLYRPSDVPNVHVADRTKYVSNPDGILSQEAVTRIDSMLADVWRKTSAEVVVVVVGSVDGDIDDFATRLFTDWGVGKKDKDNGLLYVIASDDRRAAIRTGYGMEGVVPDILAGRIIRNIAGPRFKAMDYDGGVMASVGEIARLATTPGATEELMSKYRNDSNRDTSGADHLFSAWLYIGCVLVAFMALVYIVNMFKTRRLDRYDRYQSLKKLLVPSVIVGFIGLGVPFVMALVIWLTMRYMRLRRRKCPNCHHKMRRLDEKSDNAYLTPQQDVEEKIDSVDYDVWLCDTCGETDVLPFVNTASTYKVCPHCGARASSLRSDRIIANPTTTREGQGVKDYMCRNCGYQTHVPYNIAKLPPVIVVPGRFGGGGGNGFGGGFGGGSFGGGMTGGGGASGGW